VAATGTACVPVSVRATVPVLLLILLAFPALADDTVHRLVARLLSDTPIQEDARSLCDEIGGRPTGSAANLASVEWGLERFRAAGIEARKEAFAMPALWLERGANAEIRTRDGSVTFPAAVAAQPYSVGTPEAGITAPLVDGGRGTEGDFERLGASAKGAFILIETDELEDVPGLFREYTEAAAFESRAFAAGAAGIATVGSRGNGALYRHNASLGPKNRHPLFILERGPAMRALRLLRAGREIVLSVTLDIEAGGTYESFNVIGEIKGTARPEEYVVIGAHLDSWGLGTGALDNGCNVALVIDVARQMKALGVAPRRTIRFALWNGEEQGLYGSWGYVKSHADELDRHVMASSYDIGSGRIDGFFTGGRPVVLTAIEQALAPVAGLGPFLNLDIPIVGTDNYDFMMEGIGNLVASQESANYGPHYHAASDTFDRIDFRTLRQNAAVAAAVTWAFANMDVDWSRQKRSEVQALIDATDLGDQMRTFGLSEAWEQGERGRK
jgi:hypothetical protein